MGARPMMIWIAIIGSALCGLAAVAVVMVVAFVLAMQDVYESHYS